MLRTTRGIVFHSLKYSESSLIVKIYTEFAGLQSYLVLGVHKSGAKLRAGLFQPVTLLDLEVTYSEKGTLQSIREARLARPWQMIPSDIARSSVAIFINELVYRSIREEEANPELFAFLWGSLEALDGDSAETAGFPLAFTARLMHLLGIFPPPDRTPERPLFNLRDGLFQELAPGHPEFLDRDESLALYHCLEQNREPLPIGGDTSSPPATKADRRRLLDILLTYYRLHLPGFGEVKSHRVLAELNQTVKR